MKWRGVYSITPITPITSHMIVFAESVAYIPRFIVRPDGIPSARISPFSPTPHGDLCRDCPQKRVCTCQPKRIRRRRLPRLPAGMDTRQTTAKFDTNQNNVDEADADPTKCHPTGAGRKGEACWEGQSGVDFDPTTFYLCLRSACRLGLSTN